MSTVLTYIAIAIVSAVLGVAGYEFFRRQSQAAGRDRLQEEARQALMNAERQSENILREARLEAKDLQMQAKAEFDRQQKERASGLLEQERRLSLRDESLDRRAAGMDKRDQELQKREQGLEQRDAEFRIRDVESARVLKDRREALERVAGITAEEAKRQLLAEYESQVRVESASLAKRTIEEAKENAEREAREIIARSIQRVTRDYVSEATISVVPIPNDAMKGRIIGREGRNIRAIEAATGIDLIIDETPEAVIISGFDPMRREIAKISLERLMHDGRIHPTRIEEVVEKVKVDVEKLMIEEAEKVIFEVGLSDFHPEIIKILGRLKYRTSYGQNNLYHAREAAYICGIMASELALDVRLAKRGALLHDIGKAVSHEEEGPHAMLGAEIAKKYGESEKVVNAIAAHHEQVEPICPETVLVASAEALSAARPGARREALESYVKRLEKLESLATTQKGVQKAYAIQAGREIRVIVKQEDLTDSESFQLSRELAKKIEQELTYPGQIKVTVIRESRYVEYAK